MPGQIDQADRVWTGQSGPVASEDIAPVCRIISGPGTSIPCGQFRFPSPNVRKSHLKVVSERLGHSGVEITRNLYSHVVHGLQTGAADRFGQMWRESAGGEGGR